nr:MAG TPA: hypothetical protein [Caudoviricetes sp.]
MSTVYVICALCINSMLYICIYLFILFYKNY